LPVVLYGCEIWSLTLKEEHRLKVFVFQNTVLRIFGLKGDEILSLRKMHNENVHNLLFAKCNYNDQAKGDEIGRARSMNGEGEELV
jgi:hypothetical protein